jgi:hypothetical protein
MRFVIPKSESKYAGGVLLLLVSLFFIPKVSFVSIGGHSAGLRMDDIFILFAFGVFFSTAFFLRRRLFTIEVHLLLFTLFSFISLFLSYVFFGLSLLNDHGNPLYVLRIVEYFTFFYIGLLLPKFYQLRSVIKAVFIINAVLVILQHYNFIGGFDMNGYRASITYHPIGLTAGHWEVSYLFTGIFALFLFSNVSVLEFPKKSIQFVYKNFSYRVNVSDILLFALTFLLIMMTGSRSGALGILILIFIKLKRSKQLLPVSIICTCIGLVVLGLFTFTDIGYQFTLKGMTLLARCEKIFTYSNVEIFLKTLFSTDVENNSYLEVVSAVNLGNESYDMSWYLRLTKWCYAVKYLIFNPHCWLFGVGPGFFGPALDGGLIRMTCENGIVGTSLFFYMFYKACKQDPGLYAFYIVFLVTMIFIDIYLAYKAMSFFFFVIGAFHGMLLQRKNELISSSESDSEGEENSSKLI